MKESKKENSKSKGGRPSLYKEEYAELAYNYCLLGATDVELASFLNVQKSTINNWKSEFPEFLDSIKKGKAEADAIIARRLFDRAYGATIKTQQAFKVKNVSWLGDKRIESETIEIVELQQEQAPDTTAAIFWLKNRSPQNWRDKTQVDANVEGHISANISIAPLNKGKQTFASNEDEVDK